MKDLVVLVADSNMKAAVQTLIEKRYKSLGICQVQADVLVHPRRDPGIFHEAHIFLQPLRNEYRYALVMFDHEGCGQENRPARQLEQEVKERLEQADWQGRCEVIVLEPELEAWVWSSSPHVPKVLGLTPQKMQQILQRFPQNRLGKPQRPKEAMEECLKEAKIPRSSSIYAELAETVGLQNCVDPNFVKFRQTLQKWFP
ncbi:MAG: hypothetical protein DFNUSKGM_002224 [Candidatus Fervidibacter sacchari]